MTPTPRPPAAPGPDAPRLTTLARLLNDTADDLASHAPPAAVGAAVMASLGAARFASVAPAALSPGDRIATPAWPAGRRRLAFFLLAGALLAASAWLLRPGPPMTRVPTGPAPALLRDVGTGFVPVGAPDALQRLAQRDGMAWLVPTELPRDRLALLGLPFDPARAGERVPAELLVDRDGDVLAVRIVR
jgi:hypothetical protein